jgi:ATP-dependent protease HslVU (ClpYQ) peptidase subunit
MTAIVAVVKEGKVWIGGDSAGTSGWSLSTVADPKVFINGEFIFGYTTSFRMGQLLEHSFTPPEPDENQNCTKFMVKKFIPAVKDCLKDGKFQKTKEEQDVGGNFLVGYRGQLYSIESDYQVMKVKQNYNACGCGKDISLGSLFSTETLDLSPERRITIALDAAVEFCAGVRGPYTILHV